jgi:hypothetical protein
MRAQARRSAPQRENCPLETRKNRPGAPLGHLAWLFETFSFMIRKFISIGAPQAA